MSRRLPARREPAPAAEPGDPADHLRLARAVATNMAEGVAAIRAADGLIVYTNPSWDEMFGYDAGELEGRHLSVVNAPAEQAPEERAREILAALDEHGSWRGAVHNVRKDGSHFWCEASVSEFDHPHHGTVWIAVHREITQRIAQEENLRAATERYRKAFEQTPVATALLTEDLRLVDVNDAFCALTGYEPDDLLGKPLADITHPDDAGRDPAFFAAVFSGQEPNGSAERRYVTKQGRTVAGRVEARGVSGGDGRPPYAIVTVRPHDYARRFRPGSPAGLVAAP